MTEGNTALVILAPGAEEMEVTISVDILRRAGVLVTVAGLDAARSITCSRGVKIVPDVALSSVRDHFDAILLPGGAGGAQALAASIHVGEQLRMHWQRGAVVAAVCAAPTALLSHGIALGARLTSHPSVAEALSEHYCWVDEAVVESGQLITSQGPGTTFDFALSIVGRLRGEETLSRVRQPLMLRG